MLTRMLPRRCAFLCCTGAASDGHAVEIVSASIVPEERLGAAQSPSNAAMVNSLLSQSRTPITLSWHHLSMFVQQHQQHKSKSTLKDGKAAATAAASPETAPVDGELKHSTLSNGSMSTLSIRSEQEHKQQHDSAMLSRSPELQQALQAQRDMAGAVPAGKKQIMKDVSGYCKPGQLLAIMGSSGAGN